LHVKEKQLLKHDLFTPVAEYAIKPILLFALIHDANLANNGLCFKGRLKNFA
jgi:hypothetical protein